LSQMLRQAVEALNAGNFQAAITLAEAVRVKLPDDGLVSQFLGVAYAQSGDLETGATYFRRALKAGHDSPANRTNLARVLIELDQLDEAYALCKSIALPDNEALLTLAQIERKRGDFEVAEQLYLAVLSEQDGNGAALNNLGSLYLDMGLAEKAVDILASAAAAMPHSSVVFVNLGRAYLAAGQPTEACRAFERAAMADRGNPGPLIELSRALNSINHGDAALRAIGAAAKLAPRFADVFIQMGIVFEDLQRPEDAKKAFTAAMDMDGGRAQSALHLAILFDQSNEVERVTELLDDLRKTAPESGARRYVEALIAFRAKDYTASAQWLSDIDNISLSPAITAQFAAQISDKRGLVDEAMAHLQVMKSELKGLALTHLVDQRGYINQLRGFAADLASHEGGHFAPAPEQATSGERLVFLVGFPRSGTTLLDTLLMGHSQFHVMEEQPIFSKLTAHLGALNRGNALSNDQCRQIHDQYLAQAQAVGGWDGRSILVDKNPMLQPKVAMLHRIFPRAKFIYAYRHPCDVLLSCYMQSFKPDEAMAAFLDIESAAEQYDATMAVWQSAKKLLPLQVHDVCYERLVADTENEFSSLVRFLGADGEASAMDHRKTVSSRGHVRTPSYSQIMEPINTSAVARWERYRALLEPALPILAPWVVEHGYPEIG
jgi:tetratricopeptide (TPR) repeat protein